MALYAKTTQADQVIAESLLRAKARTTTHDYEWYERIFDEIPDDDLRTMNAYLRARQSAVGPRPGERERAILAFDRFVACVIESGGSMEEMARVTDARLGGYGVRGG